MPKDVLFHFNFIPHKCLYVTALPRVVVYEGDGEMNSLSSIGQTGVSPP